MLTFTNGYRQQVSVFVAWYSPNCRDGSNWEKRGWWNIAPNRSANVLAFDLREVNRYYLYYAEASDGHTWSGSFYTHAPNEAFDFCYYTNPPNSRSLGMRELDINNYDNYTLTLIE